MVFAKGQSPMNWPTSPLSDKAREIFTEVVSGKAISGISSSFLMNFGTEKGAFRFPPLATSLLNASISAGGGGRGIPIPWGGHCLLQPETLAPLTRARPDWRSRVCKTMLHKVKDILEALNVPPS